MAAILSADATEFPLKERCSLFESFRGTELPVEVCLKIVEDVIYIDPKVTPVLIRLSKVGLFFLSCWVLWGMA